MWTPWIKHTLLNADEVVITSTPELASLRNTKNLIDLLKAARPNDKPPRLILNQVGVPKRPEIPAADFAKAVGIAPSFIIPHDPQTFGTAQSNGQMVFEVAPKSKAAELLTSFAQMLAGGEAPGKAAKSGRTVPVPENSVVEEEVMFGKRTDVGIQQSPVLPAPQNTCPRAMRSPAALLFQNTFRIWACRQQDSIQRTGGAARFNECAASQRQDAETGLQP